MTDESCFILKDGVQVRGEKFGLLFYDYRGPRLYFVPSHDLIEDDFFEGQETFGHLIETICQTHGQWPRSWVENQIRNIFDMLQNKGLICEQSVC